MAERKTRAKTKPEAVVEEDASTERTQGIVRRSPKIVEKRRNEPTPPAYPKSRESREEVKGRATVITRLGDDA